MLWSTIDNIHHLQPVVPIFGRFLKRLKQKSKCIKEMLIGPISIYFTKKGKIAISNACTCGFTIFIVWQRIMANGYLINHYKKRGYSYSVAGVNLYDSVVLTFSPNWWWRTLPHLVDDLTLMELQQRIIAPFLKQLQTTYINLTKHGP